MQIVKFDLWLSGSKKGSEICELIKRLAQRKYFEEVYEVTDHGRGKVVGFKYPEFGDSLIVIVKPQGESVAIYDQIVYLNAEVMTWMPQGGNRKDYLEYLNFPESDMENVCRRIKVSLELALTGVSVH